MRSSKSDHPLSFFDIEPVFHKFTKSVFISRQIWSYRVNFQGKILLSKIHCVRSRSLTQLFNWCFDRICKFYNKHRAQTNFRRSYNSFSMHNEPQKDKFAKLRKLIHTAHGQSELWSTIKALRKLFASCLQPEKESIVIWLLVSMKSLLIYDNCIIWRACRWWRPLIYGHTTGIFLLCNYLIYFRFAVEHVLGVCISFAIFHTATKSKMSTFIVPFN